METRGELTIDPGTLAPAAFTGEIELVVPYTGLAATRSLLQRIQTLTAGLQARIKLVAIHTIPYPATFDCPTTMHAFLVDQLMELADECSLPVDPQLVLARSREEGFRFALKSESTILIGSRRHFWRTPEERMARMLVADGHKVALLHIA
jgi:hypothetical protein